MKALICQAGVLASGFGQGVLGRLDITHKKTAVKIALPAVF